MPVKPTVSEYELNFFGGPAEGQVIKMFVEPTQVRYYCRQGSYTWWSIYPPERTVGTEVFEYKISGHAPRKEGALLTYELVEEE